MSKESSIKNVVAAVAHSQNPLEGILQQQGKFTVHENGKNKILEVPDVVKVWFVGTSVHREDGPAIVWHNGGREWYINDELHREDGPAQILSGHEFWYQKGLRHRVDGPAVVTSKGEIEFWVKGEEITELEQLHDLLVDPDFDPKPFFKLVKKHFQDSDEEESSSSS